MVSDLNQVVDISEAGMAIQTAVRLQINRSLNLYLDLSENNLHIHATGCVVWCDQLGRAGIRFPELPDPSRVQLKEWLFLNALVACDNHAAQAAEFAAKPAEQPAETTEAADSHPELEPTLLADYASVPAELSAVRREVEFLGSNLDAALQLVCERAQAFTHASGAAIALSEEEEMICRARAGPQAPSLGTRLQVGSGFSGECVRTGKLLRCDDSETDSRVDRESCRMLGIRSMIAAPIRQGDAVLGILEVFSSRPNAFGENDSTVLERLAEIIVAAVNRATGDQGSLQSGSASIAADHAGEGPSSAPLPSRATKGSGILFGRLSHKMLLIAAVSTLALGSLSLLVPWKGRSSATPAATTAPQSASPVASVNPKTTVRTVADATTLDDLRKLAEESDPAAQFALGARYATGEEVKQDYAEAARWFTEAAEHGHVVAQATLGAYYWAGHGVPKDLNKAYFWSVLAFAGGDKGSQSRAKILASRMTRAQVVAVQQQAEEWLKQHHISSQSPGR